MLPNFLKMLFLVLLAAFPLSALAQSLSPDEAARLFGQSLRKASAVEFFFLARTEEWNYSPSEVVSNSSIRIHRGCGRNCENFMEPVVSHLRQAKSTSCVSGQQNGVIFGRGAWALLYSHGGRHIQIGSHCYWNPIGIRELVAGDSMIFDG